MILPESIEVEKTLIGSIIFDTDKIATAIEYVPLEAIYDSANKLIYKTIIELYDDGIIPDNILLYEKIHTIGDISAENRLYELAEHQTTTSILEHCKIINEHWIRRKVIEKCNILIKYASNKKYAVGDIINNFDNINNSICEISSESGVKRRRRGRIIKVNDFKEDVYDYYDNGFRNIGVSTGWKTLDKHYRPAKGTLNIIAGIPGHGKSEFMDALMINISKSKGWKWAVFSPENYPYELHIQKIAEKFIGKPLLKTNRMSREELKTAIKWIDEYFYFIEPDEENVTLDAVVNLFTEAYNSHKVDGIVIDPWNEIEMVMHTGESETDYIGRSLSRIRRYARRRNVISYIVAHPAKMYKNKEGEYDVPTMYSISGSAHWYNKADNGLTIYRDFQNNMVDVHVQKVKFKVHGNIGCVPLRYVKSNGCFEDEVF